MIAASPFVSVAPSAPPPTLTPSVTVTRILALSGFPPEVKTRDIQAAFSEWEAERGGFRIKWVDDTTAYVVFEDPVVAKKAYLSSLLAPPPSLTSPTGTSNARITPYNGPDAQSIIVAVQHRQRSTSRASLSSVGSVLGGMNGAGSVAVGASMVLGHSRKGSGNSVSSVGSAAGTRRESYGAGYNATRAWASDRMRELSGRPGSGPTASAGGGGHLPALPSATAVASFSDMQAAGLSNMDGASASVSSQSCSSRNSGANSPVSPLSSGSGRNYGYQENIPTAGSPASLSPMSTVLGSQNSMTSLRAAPSAGKPMIVA